MALGNYEVLKNQRFKSCFTHYLSQLEMSIIDYIAIGVQDTINKTSTSIMSNDDWQNTFKSLELAEHDPLRRTSFNTKSSFFTFDEIDYQDSNGKEVMRLRRKHHINNGFVLLQREHGYNYILTLATGHKNFCAHKFFINNHQTVRDVFNNLISLIEPLTNGYHHKKTNHQAVDAI